MNQATFAGSAKSELSQSNGTTGNTHTHVHTHNRAALQRSSHLLAGKKNKPKKHIFNLVPLETCGAFPVSMVMTKKLFGARERQK